MPTKIFSSDGDFTSNDDRLINDTCTAIDKLGFKSIKTKEDVDRFLWKWSWARLSVSKSFNDAVLTKITNREVRQYFLTRSASFVKCVGVVASSEVYRNRLNKIDDGGVALLTEQRLDIKDRERRVRIDEKLTKNKSNQIYKEKESFDIEVAEKELTLQHFKEEITGLNKPIRAGIENAVPEVLGVFDFSDESDRDWFLNVCKTVRAEITPAVKDYICEKYGSNIIDDLTSGTAYTYYGIASKYIQVLKHKKDVVFSDEEKETEFYKVIDECYQITGKVYPTLSKTRTIIKSRSGMNQ